MIIVIVQSLSHVWLFATPETAAHQASLSFTISQSLLKPMSPGIEPMSPAWQVDSLPLSHLGNPFSYIFEYKRVI